MRHEKKMAYLAPKALRLQAEMYFGAAVAVRLLFPCAARRDAVALPFAGQDPPMPTIPVAQTVRAWLAGVRGAVILPAS